MSHMPNGLSPGGAGLQSPGEGAKDVQLLGVGAGYNVRNAKDLQDLHPTPSLSAETKARRGRVTNCPGCTGIWASESLKLTGAQPTEAGQAQTLCLADRLSAASQLPWSQRVRLPGRGRAFGRTWTELPGASNASPSTGFRGDLYPFTLGQHLMTHCLYLPTLSPK